MMKSLKSLERLARHRLDEKRLIVLELNRRQADAKQSMHALSTKLTDEETSVQKAPDMRTFFELFRQNVQERCKTLEKELVWLRTRQDTVSHELHTIFQEKKSYEITKESFTRKAVKLQQKKEQNILDEVAAQGFRRLS